MPGSVIAACMVPFSLVPVVENGGDALPGTDLTVPAHGPNLSSRRRGAWRGTGARVGVLRGLR